MPAQIEALTGDITKIAVDAVVNAANRTLMGGGGVDGAIHRAGGSAILEACEAIRREQYPDGLPIGEAVATTAGELPARWVIHTVGPVWHGGKKNEDGLLLNAYTNSYRVATELGAKSIAFPAISTGVYGFPKERAAGIVGRFIRETALSGPLERVLFVFFSAADRQVFRNHGSW
ncbi:MAG TPA: O-acetyl-ADP-ribose deacetylase [bacterium]|nr:O-acetyl-ADP-ribose deacetylase [bacterium]